MVASFLKPTHPETKMIKYIDDVTFCIPIFTENSHPMVLDEHENVIHWSESNNLVLNQSKSKSLFIKKSQRSSPVILDGVESVDEVRILGVILDSKLSWRSHVNMIVKLACQRLYGLRILKPLISSKDLRSVYQSLIRSLFEYASPAFVCLPISLETKLERFQNRVHRLICSIPYDFSVSKCPCEDFPKLKARRHQASIRLFLESMRDNDHILHNIMPNRSQRSQRIIQPPASTSRRRNSFVPFTCTLIEGTYIM